MKAFMKDMAWDLGQNGVKCNLVEWEIINTLRERIVKKVIE